jgi:hypothetical protein
MAFKSFLNFPVAKGQVVSLSNALYTRREFSLHAGTSLKVRILLSPWSYGRNRWSNDFVVQAYLIDLF